MGLTNKRTTSDEIYFLTEDDASAINAVMESHNTLNANFTEVSSSVVTLSDRTTNIRVASGLIPAISASAREVVTLNLEVLSNRTHALIGFYTSDVPDDQIRAGLNPNAPLNPYSSYTLSVINVQDKYNFAESSLKSLLYVSEDYNDAMKFYNANPEKYGANSSMPFGFTYESIGVGVLVGWYSLSSTNFWSLDKKLQIESAWLTQSGSNTILNIAFYNTDVAANTSGSFKVGVYE